ncbi:hypothetical protein GOODEAATRI_003309 [Goodea atripinnis]|uniref:Uncharacterized protein n=1 Tax=Goodea atripinnis TaxID=208336 RepID=A0ABV0MEP1_9TELE
MNRIFEENCTTTIEGYQYPFCACVCIRVCVRMRVYVEHYLSVLFCLVASLYVVVADYLFLAQIIADMYIAFPTPTADLTVFVSWADLIPPLFV